MPVPRYGPGGQISGAGGRRQVEQEPDRGAKRRRQRDKRREEQAEERRILADRGPSPVVLAVDVQALEQQIATELDEIVVLRSVPLQGAAHHVGPEEGDEQDDQPDVDAPRDW